MSSIFDLFAEELRTAEQPTSQTPERSSGDKSAYGGRIPCGCTTSSVEPPTAPDRFRTKCRQSTCGSSPLLRGTKNLSMKSGPLLSTDQVLAGPHAAPLKDPSTLCGNQFVAEMIEPNVGQSGIKFVVFHHPLKTGQEPVALFIHGVICQQLDPDALFPVAYKEGYTTLFNCLARTGVVSVSIQPQDNSQSAQGRADRMKFVLEDVHAVLMNNDLGPLTNRSVVLMGHSRGGEAAILAAGLISMSNTFGVQIRAVIGLGPAAGAQSILPNTVPNFLAIVGTLDADVTYKGVRDTFFTEITGPATSKYLVGVLGGTHISAMDSSWEFIPSDMTCEVNLGSYFYDNNGHLRIAHSSYRTAQARLASAFLLWKIYGQDDEWSGYFCNRGIIAPGTITLATVRESSEQSVGGHALVGAGFINHAAGATIQKEPITSLFSTSPSANAYRLKWNSNNGTPLRLFFTPTIFLSPNGAILIDIGVVALEDPQLQTLNTGDHHVRVTLLASCDDPYGCGAVGVPPEWAGPGNIPTYTVRMLPRLQKGGPGPDPTVNSIHTLCAEVSDFDVSPEFLASVQVVALEFFEPAGDLVVFEPRFRS